MVYFTCNHCGESIKKPSVDKHYLQKCRGAPKFVSCMDCHKDFRGEEYAAHTKCITEAEKYSGKDFVPKPTKNTGQKKQESWLEVVRTALDTNEFRLKPEVRDLIQRMQSFENVPRKKAKFVNFVINCMKCRAKLADDVWEVLEKANARTTQNNTAVNGNHELVNGKENLISDNSNITESQQNGESNNTETTNITNGKEKRKRKTSEQTNGEGHEPKVCKTDDSITIEENGEIPLKFDWKQAIKTIISSQENGIKINKLKKKLLKKYKKFHSQDQVEINIDKKFKKYSKKLGLELRDDIVKMTS